MTAVITAVYGGYDDLLPPLPQSVDADFVCVTDNPDLQVDGWRMIVEPRAHMHPRLAAKVPKFLPARYTDEPSSIWMDASVRIKSESFVKDLSSFLESGPLLQWKHPQRDCILGEAAVSAEIFKYLGQPVREQADAYLTAGHPAHWGLWATGVIVRWHEGWEPIGFAWLNENVIWSYQDQISQPYVLREFGVRPLNLPADLWANEWVEFRDHKSAS